MEAQQSKILVFETNIKFKKDVIKIARLINGESRIRKWNVDREDSDKILRVESLDLSSSEIIQLLSNAGYHCKELID